MTRPLLTLFIAALLSVLGAAPAAAYVRTATDDAKRKPLYWSQSCAQLSPDDRPPPTLTQTDVEQALARAMQNWNRRIAPCSVLSLQQGPSGPRRDPKRSPNQVVFVTSLWERPDYDPGAAAVTRVTYTSSPVERNGPLTPESPVNPEHGNISGVLIELNAVDFHFALVDKAHPEATSDPNDGTILADLENTLTHELGHVLGLAHTCWDGVVPRPVDDKGQAVIGCTDGALPPEVVQATMFPYAAAGETSKREPTQDDVNGICGSYPADMALLPCDQTLHPSCALAGRHGGEGQPLLGLFPVLLLLLLLLRKCRKPPFRGAFRVTRRCG